VLKVGCIASMLVLLLIVVQKSSLAEVVFLVGARSCAVNILTWESNCIAAVDHTLRVMAVLQLVKVEDNEVVSSCFLRQPFLVKLEESQSLDHSEETQAHSTHHLVHTRSLGDASEHMDEIDCLHRQDVKSARAQKSWRLARSLDDWKLKVQQKLVKKCMVKRGLAYRYEQTLEVMLGDPC